MFDLADTNTRRKQFVEVPAPARRIFAIAKSLHFCPIQDDLDAAANAARCFVLPQPDRLQDAGDQSCVDTVYRKLSDDRMHISLECRRPLRGMLRVLPARTMRNNVFFGAMTEAGRRLGSSAL